MTSEDDHIMMVMMDDSPSELIAQVIDDICSNDSHPGVFSHFSQRVRNVDIEQQHALVACRSFRIQISNRNLTVGRLHDVLLVRISDADTADGDVGCLSDVSI